MLGRAVGSLQSLLPLGIVQQILLVCQLLAEQAVTFGSSRLLFQFFNLPTQFGLQVGNSMQVLAGIFQTGFGFFAAFLILRYTGRLFYISTQFFRSRFNNARNHALLNHRITARAHAGTEK